MTNNIYIPEETEQLIHYPHPLPRTGAVTLCGWVDVPYEEKGGKRVTCQTCLAIVAFCQRKYRRPKK